MAQKNHLGTSAPLLIGSFWGLVQALPALPLQILDFNGDGLNDIVLVSHDGLYGWAQVRAASLLPTPISLSAPHGLSWLVNNSSKICPL